MTPEITREVGRIRRLINPLAIANSKHTRLNCPLPVWDSTGRMVGVGISMPVMMGGVPCQSEATFTVTLGDSDGAISAKGQAAIEALKQQIVLTIKPARKIDPVKPERPDDEATEQSA